MSVAAFLCTCNKLRATKATLRRAKKLPDYGVWQVEVGVGVTVLVYGMKRCWSQEKAIGFCILAQGRWREAPVMDEESLVLIFYHHFTLTVSCFKQDER